MPLNIPKLTVAEIEEAADYSEDLEAAIGIADRWGHDRELVREFLSCLAIQDVRVAPWTMPRVARYILGKHLDPLGRPKQFSANDVTEILPARARRHGTTAIRALLGLRLIEYAHRCPCCGGDIGQQFELSRKRGARGWIMRLYALTDDGEKLAGRIAVGLVRPQVTLEGFAGGPGTSMSSRSL